MKAFRLMTPKYFDVEIIYAAESAGKARHSAKNSLEESGFRNVKYGDIPVHRAPEYDGEAAKCGRTMQIGWREAGGGMSYGVLSEVSK